MAGKRRDVLLADVIDVKHGFAFSGENICEEPTGDILLTPGNFAIGGGFKADKYKYFNGEVPNEYILDEDALIITMTDLSKQGDTLGYPALVPKSHGPRFLHNQRLGKVIIKPKAELDKHYLYYLLCTAQYRHEVLASATGTTVKHTSPKRILAHKVSLPQLSEQRTIAHVLGTLDAKIQLNRSMNQTLESMAQALFKSWFVDFDPVKAKAAGKKTGLPKVIDKLFPSSFQDSELGMIPKGWRMSAVGDHMINYDSKRIPVSGRERAKRKGIYPYHGAAGVMDYVDDYLFDGIYLLVGEDGSVVTEKGMAVTQYAWGKIWVNNHAHVLQGKGSVSTEQLFLYFQHETVAPYVTGAVQPKLSQGRMNMMPFIDAGDAICNIFSEVVCSWFDRLRGNKIESSTLLQIRNTLLPNLISGTVKVKDKT